MIKKMKQFKITNNKGFHLALKNGWTVSCQFGAGNYCDNYEGSLFDDAPKESDTVELWAWNDLMNYPEQPKGYQTMNQFLEFVEEVRKFPREKRK